MPLLIAEQGDGPEIPALAVPLIVARIVGGQEFPGAGDAGLALALSDFEPVFANLAITHASEECPLPPPLYRRVMEERFEDLPAAIRQIHSVLHDDGASGEAWVTRASTVIGALVARVTRFPPAGQYQLQVDFTEREGKEHWTRAFGTFAFTSTLSDDAGKLVERIGPKRFTFNLPGDFVLEDLGFIFVPSSLRRSPNTP